MFHKVGKALENLKLDCQSGLGSVPIAVDKPTDMNASNTDVSVRPP